MAEIVNLRQVKKQRAKAAEAQAAAANRAVHGRTKAEEDAESLEAERRRAVLDGARLERDGEPRE